MKKYASLQIKVNLIAILYFLLIFFTLVSFAIFGSSAMDKVEGMDEAARLNDLAYQMRLSQADYMITNDDLKQGLLQDKYKHQYAQLERGLSDFKYYTAEGQPYIKDSITAAITNLKKHQEYFSKFMHHNYKNKETIASDTIVVAKQLTRNLSEMVTLQRKSCDELYEVGKDILVLISMASFILCMCLTMINKKIEMEKKR